MCNIKAVASSIINVAPEKVYAILANYRDEHPKILPDQYFSDYTVERGGMGEGTIVRFQTHVLGRSRTIRAEVTEPEPGRVLKETDLHTGLETTFVVEPIDDRRVTSVTIETGSKSRQGTNLRNTVTKTNRYSLFSKAPLCYILRMSP